MNERETDKLERLVGLRMDGRLHGEHAGELDRLLSGSQKAREIEAGLLGLRRLLRESGNLPINIPAGLLEHTLGRVAQVRTRLGEERALLPFARRLALAAAVLLAITVFAAAGGLAVFVDNGGVRASPNRPQMVPTIEDRLAGSGTDAPPLRQFLRWHFLRSAP